MSYKSLGTVIVTFDRNEAETSEIKIARGRIWRYLVGGVYYLNFSNRLGLFLNNSNMLIVKPCCLKHFSRASHAGSVDKNGLSKSAIALNFNFLNRLAILEVALTFIYCKRNSRNRSPMEMQSFVCVCVCLWLFSFFSSFDEF